MFHRTLIANGKCPDGRSCVRPRRHDEIDLFRVGQRNIFGRRLVCVHPMGMRVINPQEFESPLAQFLHQVCHLLGSNFVIPDRISRDVFRRESLRNDPVVPRKNSAAFPMRLASGMLEELPIYFAATSDGTLHFGSIQAISLTYLNHSALRTFHETESSAGLPCAEAKRVGFRDINLHIVKTRCLEALRT